MTKKVLIITYYWPPAGGPGVQRWLKFVKYLPGFNIDPIVYCPENPNYPIIDQSLEDEIPNAVTVLKHPISEPYRFAKLFSKKNTKTISSGVIPEKKKQSLVEKLMLYVRGNFFIPDARKNWINPSVSFLSNYIKENNINTIITTGPPHSLHLTGLQLKEQLDVNWLADFRDPWTTIGYHKDLKLTEASQKKHLELEHNVLNASGQIIVTSQHTKNEFETKTKRPIAVITNGYDSHSVILKNKDEKFSLSHIGSLLSERNPKVLWEVFSELVKEDDSFAADFELKLIGIVSEEVIDSIKSYDLGDYINSVGYVSHNEAIHAQMASQILLLIEIDSESTKAIIPGKLFEYMQSKTPILALGPNDSDVEQIIKTTNTGTYFNYNSKIALKNQIIAYYKLYKTESLKAHPIGIEKYSRKEITKQLSELIFANN